MAETQKNINPLTLKLKGLWEDRNSEKGKLPLKIKLKAWWEGYDQDEYGKMILGEEEEEEDDDAEPVVAEKPEPVAALLDSSGWGEARVNINQLIWGEGFCGPGGEEHIVSMTKLLALDKKMSLLDVGSTLGGKGRALAENYGVWVTGLEPSKLLTEKGNEISKVKGMGKKVEIIEADFEVEQKFDHNFDRIFSKETLFTVNNKEQFLRDIYAATKADGLALFTDYILGSEGSSMKDEFKEWRDSEPVRPYCQTAEEYKELIEKVGYKTRVNEDITAQYIELISDAWKGATSVVNKLLEEEDGKEMIDVLLSEAEFWTKRVKLLKSGELKVWRVLGYKADTRSTMMSDW